MQTEIYSIYDKQAKIYGRPMQIVNRGKALQVFQSFVNDNQNQSDINKWPEQYNLMLLATFDDNTGVLTVKETPEYIANGMDLVESKNKQFTLTELFELYDKYLESKVKKLHGGIN